MAVTLSLGASSIRITPGQSGHAMPHPQDPSSRRSLQSHPLATHIRRHADPEFVPGTAGVLMRRLGRERRLCI